MTVATAIATIAPLVAVAAEPLRILLPLNRTAYQTNEWIDVSVVRVSGHELGAGDLTLTVTGADASKMVFTFPVKAVPVQGDEARATEHLHLNGWLLRPGRYTVESVVDGATATTSIELFSHVRQSTFKTVHWASAAQGDAHIGEGERSLGFNVILGDYRPGTTAKNAATTLRGGADYMQANTMGGGHQMDLRMEADWSDPYVTRGGAARAVQQAFAQRTTPNAIGVHLYDEPGLTWWKHARTGEFTPHNIPAQDRSYRSAFDRDPLQYDAVQPDDPAAVAWWTQWAHWKEEFMEAAWKEAAAGVRAVRPDYLPITQSMYAWNAYTDGYYFNVVRSLPVMSGHGGYDDGPGSYFYPSFHFEFGRMRDFDKPIWYLPMWFNTNSDLVRLEQNLSFMNNLQGMSIPPWFKVHEPNGKPEAQGVVETNKAMARLGTIFTTMPVTRPEVAVLYSLSQAIDAQIRSGMKDNYEGGGHTRARLLTTYIASKMLHVPMFPIVEEDVLDGTLATHHKAVVLAGINALDPKVSHALQDYIAQGGAVLVTDDCQVQILGATRVGAEASTKQYDLVSKLWQDGKQKESSLARGAGIFMEDAAPLARALKVHFHRIGIKPVLDVDNQSIVVSRQAQGEVEYLFAVNAAYDATGGSPQAIKAAEGTLKLPADGRPVYDALHSTVAGGFRKQGDVMSRRYRFGPGQMRVFARTARPVGGVQVLTPQVSSDYTVAHDPIHVDVNAAVVDTAQRILSGAIPLRLRLLDPTGRVRYDLYRATGESGCKMVLPLAANDPEGTWRVDVQELLSGTTGAATFHYTPPRQLGAAAGATHRAVFFGDDKEHAFSFFRAHHDVTIVKGTSDYDTATAERLTTVLKPWGVRATITDAETVNKPRQLTDVEAKTWVGLDFGRVEEAGQRRPTNVGFAVNGPVILVGNPRDNPLIAAVDKLGFLPYTPSADFPGRGRGYVAWQRDAVGIGQESLTLIATDAAGMAEAAGTLYEAAAGLTPLMPLEPPASATITAAAREPQSAPAAPVLWQTLVPDRPNTLKMQADKAIIATADGTETTLDATGKMLGSKLLTTGSPLQPVTAPVVPPALKASLVAGRIPKFVSAVNGTTAIAYWGGLLQVLNATGAVKLEQQFEQDITAVGWLKSELVVCLADGRVLALAGR